MQARVKKLTKDLLRASTGRLCDAMCSPRTTLVIFSRGRTGSNLLISLLASHPKVFQHGEIFGEHLLQHEVFRNAINKMGSVAYFEHCTRRLLAEQVVGLKFLYYQLEPEYAQRWNVPDLPSVLPVLERSKELRIVHLKRRNLLETLVSWKIAAQTHRYRQYNQDRSSGAGKAHSNITVNLSYEECRHEFEQTEQWQRYYDAAFANHPFVEMYYEDLVADKHHEMARVLDLLSLEKYELRSPLRKQNTRPLEDIVENFAELRERFADTRHAGFFTGTSGQSPRQGL